MEARQGCRGEKGKRKKETREVGEEKRTTKII